ncbi:MAG TPA: DUF4168 domain-containing protein [Phenylobacterium sp.]|uniref:DUF4168 domain-containing protein n=1 Tax=Phenylobacterium sp. TaxID=1871053 RepID=UPI002F922E83
MRIAILAAGLLGVAATAASAQAQTAPAAEAPAAAAPAAPAAGGFSDEDLKAFGAAMTEIQKINGEYGPKITAAADANAKAEVQKEMIGKMGAAVQASGLSAEKYNDMSNAVQKDAALRARLTEVLNAAPAA